MVGGATVGNCIADVAGVSKQTVGRMNDELGDLGDVAAALKRRDSDGEPEDNGLR